MSNVGRTIIEQIRAYDFWALGAWAARDYVFYPDGVLFRVNCPKLKHGLVKVTLNERDLYDIEFMKFRVEKKIVDEKVADIYVDMLVTTIDERLG